MAESDGHRGGRLKAVAGNLTLALLSCLVVVLVVEGAFRLAPRLLLPAGVYGGGRLHPALGMNVHGQRVIYNKVRYLVRAPNREGFMDVDHEATKPHGTVRVGFFGDSFVESIQVPLDRVFFRRLGSFLGGNVESLGFGLSGWGTLQAKRAFEVFAPKYDLDIAVYVFVENDPGNNCLDISARTGDTISGMPFAELHPDGAGYDVRWITEPGREPWWYAAGKLVQRYSLLAHVVLDRVAALRAHGVKAGADAADAQMSSVAASVPRPTDLPSTWPVPYRERAERLGELLLRDWRDLAASRNIGFVVFYVPRGEDQLAGTLSLDDTWLPWLRGVCGRLAIPLVDPSRALSDGLERDGHVYDDHWTEAGHGVVASTLAESLAPMIRRSNRGGDHGLPGHPRTEARIRTARR